MKFIIAGGIGVLSGVMLFGFALVAAAVYAPQVAASGYYTNYGIYGTTLLEIAVVPIAISIILFGLGIVLLLMGVDKGWKAKYFLVEGETNEPVQEKENV